MLYFQKVSNNIIIIIIQSGRETYIAEYRPPKIFSFLFIMYCYYPIGVDSF